MSASNSFRPSTLISCITLTAVGGALSAMQQGCGEPFSVIACAAHRYSVVPETGTMLEAIYFPPGQEPEVFLFSPPSLIVDDRTHQDIQNPQSNGDAEAQLRLLLADATIELCRRTLEAEVEGFNFRIDANNCIEYSSTAITIDPTMVEASEPDPQGAHIQEDPTCFAACLVDECSYGDTEDYDSPPDHPFTRTVGCHCRIETIGDCMSSSLPDFPEDVDFTASICVPEETPPADYCRVSVTDYLSASLRMVAYHSWHPNQVPGTCGSWTPANLDVTVTCLPVDEPDADIQTEAAEAYTIQDDAWGWMLQSCL
jgi:hypothetical protein